MIVIPSAARDLLLLCHRVTRSSPSSRHPAADPAAHPLVRGIAPYAAIQHASGMPLRPSTANECKRAAVSYGTKQMKATYRKTRKGSTDQDFGVCRSPPPARESKILSAN